MNILDNYKRKQALKSITGDMGSVVETENEIICYVTQNSIRLFKLKETIIFLFGCNDNKNIDIAKKFNINKPMLAMLMLNLLIVILNIVCISGLKAIVKLRIVFFLVL